MMFVLQQSQRNGLAAGLVAALGIEVGVFIYVILSALGIITIFNLYPPVYRLIQLVGAAYLLYLAYLAWPRALKSEAAKVYVSKNGVFLKGVLINLTNPKIVLFFFSLIPQFIPQSNSKMAFILYGMVFNIGGIITNTTVAFLSHRVSRMVTQANWFNYVPPLLFLLIAGVSIAGRI